MAVGLLQVLSSNSDPTPTLRPATNGVGAGVEFAEKRPSKNSLTAARPMNQGRLFDEFYLENVCGIMGWKSKIEPKVCP
jgi:hypothetical protein